MTMKRIIHVNPKGISNNHDTGGSEPVCMVLEGALLTKCHEVIIHGPSKLVYRPDQPTHTNSRVYIETEADIEKITWGEE